MTNANLAANAAPVLFGLKLYEVLTLIGIIIGPIAAVIITLGTESYRAKREQRLRVLRMLLATFKVAADVNWSVAMNMILIEFASHKDVMDARRDYLAIASQRAQPGREDEHGDRLHVKQIALVYRVAKALGYRITEGELKTETYISEGMIARDNILIDSQKAMRDLAKAQQRMVELTEQAIARSRASNENPLT